ncbi:VWA domain-containing protein [Patulibacter brassicae]|uniref:VWA domain-containing protein n=1 Tax=Patulibacter brassicae TaxID=1705717 RepID=A0ABU4VKF5_9ACTN|nr:VWA domain-containing protein [Patulibacter brassicae]MDX8152317.1 VWA domain-containing protein [Patulibacter brassicae]
MSLHAPWSLLALLLVPVLLLAIRAAARRPNRHVVRMPALATLRTVVPATPSHRRWLPLALLLLAVALLVLALARPQRTVAVPEKRTSVMLVSDASRSMLATDVPPTRLDAARAAAIQFLRTVPRSVRVGVVGYSTTPHTIVEPTTNRQAARSALESLQADGATATGDALSVALDALQAEGDARGSDRSPGAILLLSDGAAQGGADPVEVAGVARQLRIPIYTVALGTPNGTYQVPGGVGPGGWSQGPQTRAATPDPATLRRIARISGGQAFTVDDASELRRIYERLGQRVGSEEEQRELTAGVGGAALVALVLALVLGLRWRPRAV